MKRGADSTTPPFTERGGPFPADDWSAWVEYDIGQWTIAYLVGARFGSAVVAEVRIFPRSGRTDYGEWNRTQDDVPPGGLPSRIRDRLTPAIAARDAIRLARQATPRRGGKQPAVRALSPHTERLLETVALLYEEAKRSGSAAPARDVWEGLKRRGLHYERATVRDLIRRARKAGVLVGDVAADDVHRRAFFGAGRRGVEHAYWELRQSEGEGRSRR